MWCVRVLALWCACALLAAARADDKRAEMAPAPFVLGSRYGRSQPRMLAPRNDRFFMGSRYGKRSGAGAGADAGALLCEYTGVFPLYRCLRSPYRDLFDNKRDDELTPDFDN